MMQRVNGWLWPMVPGVLAAVLAGGSGAGYAATTAARTSLPAKLATMPAPRQVTATLVVDKVSQSKGVNHGKPVAGTARVGVHLDATGLQLAFASALLAKVAAEKKASATHADQPTPTLDALGAVDPVAVSALLDQAQTLRNALKTEQATGVRRVDYHGQSVREFTFTQPQDKSSGGPELKDYSNTYTLWVNDAGVPLAMHHVAKFKACKMFLCLHFTIDSRDTLAMVDGCLMLASGQHEQKTSGLGQDADERTTYTLKVSQATCGTQAVATRD
ncbi:MAG TPA: hypothetical protein VF271_04095 [Rhodanobacteraceae bacterium]